MAFFSLTDIKYVSGQNRDSEFALNGNSFDAYNRRYPIDIGNTDKGHYMTFFIFTQERTQVEGYQQGGFMLDPSGGNATVLDTPSQNALGAVQFIAEELIGDNRNREVDESVSVKENPNFFETFKNSSAAATLRSLKNSEVGQNLLKRGNFFRTINRTKDSISLYMPDTLAFDYAQSYSDLSVTADLGNVGLGLSAAASIYDQRKSGVSNQIKNAAPFAAEFAKNKLGSNGGQTLFSDSCDWWCFSS
jgi:hypothetical protein